MKKAPAWRGIAIRVGIVAAIVVAGLVLRDRLSSSATDLQVGDCFDEPANTTEVSEVQHQPCTDPHDGEVIYVADHPGDVYPSEETFVTYVRANCIPAFETYIGRDYETDTEFDFGYFYPLADGWGKGDHEVSCYAYRLDEAKLTKSVKGSSAPSPS